MLVGQLSFIFYLPLADFPHHKSLRRLTILESETDSGYDLSSCGGCDYLPACVSNCWKKTSVRLKT